MRGLLIFLLIVWLVIAVIGFVLDVVKWLAIVGLVLFVLTLLYWVFKARRSRNKRTAP